MPVLVDPAGDGGDLGVVQRGGDLGAALEVVDRRLESRVGALDAADDGDGARRLLDGALEWAGAVWLFGGGRGIRCGEDDGEFAFDVVRRPSIRGRSDFDGATGCVYFAGGAGLRAKERSDPRVQQVRGLRARAQG